jgi:hypothetical protein
MLERQCYHGRMRTMLALLLMVVSCGDDSSAPPGGPDGPISDAPPPNDGQMMSDGTPMVDAHFIDGPCDEIEAGNCCSRRRIFLNFDGVDLVADNAMNDARTGHTFLLMSNKTVPPFLNGAPGRDTVINGIVMQLQQQLSGYDVELTRTRPGAGDYMMITFGGDSATILGTAGFGAFGPLDCGDTNLDDIALVFDSNAIIGTANSAMFVLGISLGLSTTTLMGDCLSTMPANTPCTLSTAAPLNTTGVCPGAPSPQNEPAAFAADLRCR